MISFDLTHEQRLLEQSVREQADYLFEYRGDRPARGELPEYRSTGDGPPSTNRRPPTTDHRDLTHAFRSLA
jgi:hypothetical protein